VKLHPRKQNRKFLSGIKTSKVTSKTSVPIALKTFQIFKTLDVFIEPKKHGARTKYLIKLC